MYLSHVRGQLDLNGPSLNDAVEFPTARPSAFGFKSILRATRILVDDRCCAKSRK
jgi:hypothetical protein